MARGGHRTRTTRSPPQNVEVPSCPHPSQATPAPRELHPGWIWGWSGHPARQGGGSILGCLKGGGERAAGNAILDAPQNQFKIKKPFCTARGPQTPQPNSELVLGHSWGKKVRVVVLEVFLRSLSCTKVRSGGCSPEQLLLLRVFYKQESFLSMWSTKFTPH